MTITKLKDLISSSPDQVLATILKKMYKAIDNFDK